MKAYVDELPNLCCYCKFYYGNSQGAVCRLNGILTNHNETLGQMKRCCPLQSLADHDKQVRREVCEKINAELYNKMVLYNKKLEYSDIALILNQLQGEDNGN